ncbi:MAG: type IV pilus biogenesis protein EbsA [Cyanobacteriota bacterium]|nr:type IV pilus biogenesis protein EbsA [Cyanobacteriota bacterium]
MTSAWAILVENCSGVSASVSDAALLALFAPYCGGLAREGALDGALKLFQQQQFQGTRPVQGAAGHRFVLGWTGQRAPLEMVACELTFPEQPRVHYSFELSAHQLVSWLMERTSDGNEAGGEQAMAAQDLPDAFWQWLLVGTEQDGGAA